MIDLDILILETVWHLQTVQQISLVIDIPLFVCKSAQTLFNSEIMILKDVKLHVPMVLDKETPKFVWLHVRSKT